MAELKFDFEKMVDAFTKTAKERGMFVSRWIPIDEMLPEVNEDGYSDYILLSFENFSLPTIGMYWKDEDGSGAFHDGDDDRTLASYGLFVNAWMPLPKRYGGDGA